MTTDSVHVGHHYGKGLLFAAFAFPQQGHCISVQRVMIHRPVYNHTLELLLDKISAMKVGDPRDPSVEVGPMIDEWAAKEAQEKIR